MQLNSMDCVVAPFHLHNMHLNQAGIFHFIIFSFSYSHHTFFSVIRSYCKPTQGKEGPQASVLLVVVPNSDKWGGLLEEEHPM